MVIKEYSNGCKAVLATRDHAEQLAPFLRHDDKLEVGAYGFENSLESLLSALDNDDLTITALDKDDVPFAMFGVGKGYPNDYIWLLGSDSVKDNWYSFAKASRQFLPLLIQEYPLVFNLVLKNYTDSVKWLKWLGADFIREVSLGGHDFYEFVIVNKNYNKS